MEVISLTEQNHERLLLLLLRHHAGLPGGDRLGQPPELPWVRAEPEQPSAQPLPHHGRDDLRVSLHLSGGGVLPVYLLQVSLLTILISNVRY